MDYHDYYCNSDSYTFTPLGFSGCWIVHNFKAGIGLFIDWITGADLDKSTGHDNHLEDNISDEEKAFWDYLIWSELFKHKN